MNKISLSILLLVGCTDGGDPSENPPTTTEPGPAWSQSLDATEVGFMSGVWGTSATDVYAVGGNGDQGLAYHFDGITWEPMELPAGTPLLIWLHGFSSSDIYAVGVNGSAVHYDGTSWEPMASTNTTEQLWGVWGETPDDLWVVGGDPDVGEPNILHWDGSMWTEHTVSPEENVRGATTLYKVWGIDGEVFITGQYGELLKLESGEWIHQSAGQLANQNFVGIWGTSASNVIAVGGVSSGRIATYDGDAWTTISPTTPGLSAVQMLSPTEAIVGGESGYVGLFDFTTGELTQEETTNTYLIHGMWSDGQGTVFGVGGLWSPPENYQGVIMVRES